MVWGDVTNTTEDETVKRKQKKTHSNWWKHRERRHETSEWHEERQQESQTLDYFLHLDFILLKLHVRHGLFDINRIREQKVKKHATPALEIVTLVNLFLCFLIVVDQNQLSLTRISAAELRGWLRLRAALFSWCFFWRFHQEVSHFKLMQFVYLLLSNFSCFCVIQM